MKILIEVEPVLVEGGLSDKEYYGFRVLGLPDKHGFGRAPVFRCADGVYPGNDVMRQFINQRAEEGLP